MSRLFMATALAAVGILALGGEPASAGCKSGGHGFGGFHRSFRGPVGLRPPVRFGSPPVSRNVAAPVATGAQQFQIVDPQTGVARSVTLDPQAGSQPAAPSAAPAAAPAQPAAAPVASDETPPSDLPPGELEALAAGDETPAAVNAARVAPAAPASVSAPVTQGQSFLNVPAQRSTLPIGGGFSNVQARNPGGNVVGGSVRQFAGPVGNSGGGGNVVGGSVRNFAGPVGNSRGGNVTGGSVRNFAGPVGNSGVGGNVTGGSVRNFAAPTGNSGNSGRIQNFGNIRSRIGSFNNGGNFRNFSIQGNNFRRR